MGKRTLMRLIYTAGCLFLKRSGIRSIVYPWPRDKAKRVIALGEELLQKSTNTRQRESAIQCLCYTYDCIDKEKALYYADISGSFRVTREDFRTTILDGEEGVKACQSYIQSLIHTAAMTATGMTSKIQFSHEETIEAYQFAIDILKRLYPDGNIGFYAFDVSYYYQHIALQYAEMNDSENALEALAESCKYAIIEATLSDMNYTAPMVNRVKYRKSSVFKNYTGNSCNLRLKDLEDKRLLISCGNRKFHKERKEACAQPPVAKF